LEKSHNVQSVKSASAESGPLTRPRARVLVVDDDANILLLHTEVLSRSGYQVETAVDGAAAWEALQAGSYDLLITDCNMPRLTGLELIEKVRAAKMSLPIILMSGTLLPGELDQNAARQSVATMAKPFSIQQLLATVNRVMELHAPAFAQVQKI